MASLSVSFFTESEGNFDAAYCVTPKKGTDFAATVFFFFLIVRELIVGSGRLWLSAVTASLYVSKRLTVPLLQSVQRYSNAFPTRSCGSS